MKKILAIMVVFAMISVVVPTAISGAPVPPVETAGVTEVGPQGFTTSALIQAGGGNAPFVKCKWETTNFSFNDDDMAANGIQIDPECGQNKLVYYWAICTDPEGVDTITNVWVDVWHPDEQYKYQKQLPNKMSKQDGIDAFNAVYANNPTIITYNPELYYDGNGAHTMNYSEIIYELEQDQAYLWWGTSLLNYCQPAGMYTAKVVCFDDDGLNSTFLTNLFWYVPTVCVEYQFSEVSYGSVSVGTEKPAIAGPHNVRNTGNVPVSFVVKQDDLGIEIVDFAARLGAFGQKVYYGPDENASIPGNLSLCTLEKLDFFINITKGFSSETAYSGNLELWAHQFGAPPYTTRSEFVDMD